MSKTFVLIIFAICFVGFAACSSVKETQVAAAQSAPDVYPAYSGPKKRIAVLQFDNKVKGVYGGANIGEGMAEMLTTELIKTGRFVVVEREALQDIVGEQALGQTGLVTKETASKAGQMLGVQMLVKGVVSEFEQNESGGLGGLSWGPVSLGAQGSNALVGVDIRLIDSSTGQVLQSHNASGKVSSSSIGLGITEGQVNFNSQAFQNSPIGQATRQAIHNAVSFIVEEMEKVPFEAKVVNAENNKVVINAGSLMNIHQGDTFNAYTVGESFIDPDTGTSLGAERKLAGTVQVMEVQEKYSVGVSSENSHLRRGDALRFK